MIQIILHRIIFCLAIFLFSSEINFANELDSQITKKPFYNIILDDFVEAGSDFVYISKEIICPNAKGLITLGGVTAGTLLLFPADEEIRKLAVRNHSYGADDFFNFTNNFGDGFKVGFLPASIYLGGLIFGDDDVRITGRLIFESLTLSGYVTSSLKVVLGRSRPYMNNGNTYFKPFSFTFPFNSLPSGHTTVAFAVASVISARIDKWWAYTGFYSLATLPALSRIYLDQHWISDVFLGAAVGTISGLAVVNAEKFRKCEKGEQISKLTIYPSLNGIALRYEF
jgi:membrane-associated phospholipid phosphatase